jgi:hypothetical protein
MDIGNLRVCKGFNDGEGYCWMLWKIGFRDAIIIGYLMAMMWFFGILNDYGIEVFDESYKV